MTVKIKIAETAQQLKQLHGSSQVFFVPTMGNLHEGHLSLVHHARSMTSAAGDNIKVCVSIFVNPLQFTPQEDFATYPRTIQKDLELLTGLANTVYLPAATEICPDNQDIVVTSPTLGKVFEGIDRPEFFSGVLTVVAKLFNLVQPHVAIFGRKDYQQQILIKAMCQQLNFPVTIVSLPTVRAKNGLALSSRNSKLSNAERAQASILATALFAAASKIHAKGSPVKACATATSKIQAAGLTPSYIACVLEETLQEQTEQTDQPCAILAAVKLGNIRLIDCVGTTIELAQGLVTN